MKAASAVLVQSQRQMTIIGLAPSLLGVVCSGPVIGGVLLAIFGIIEFLVPVAVVSFAAVWLVLVRKMRANPFFDRELFLGTGFWVGKGRSRVLIAGGRA